MKTEKISAILKFISIVFFILFISLIVFSIISQNDKNIFVILLILSLSFVIPFFIFFKYTMKNYSKYSYKKIKDKIKSEERNREERNEEKYKEEKSSDILSDKNLKNLVMKNSILKKSIVKNSIMENSIIKDYQKAIIDLKEKNDYILGRFDVIYSLNKIYRKDMSGARKIQETMLNKKAINNRFISSACFYQPFEIIGGDFFDYIYIDNSKILFIMSDISGHGIGAAIVTSMLKTIFRTLSDSYYSTSSLLKDINNYLADTLPAYFYLTIIIAEIDLINKKITYSNASHTPLLILKNEEIKEYNTGGTIVGLFPNAFYEEETIELSADDIFLFFTDGITEASKSKNKYDIYGIDRFKKIILENKNLNPKDLITSIKNDFYDYHSYRSPDDDCSIFLFKVK